MLFVLLRPTDWAKVKACVQIAIAVILIRQPMNSISYLGPMNARFYPEHSLLDRKQIGYATHAQSSALVARDNCGTTEDQRIGHFMIWLMMRRKPSSNQKLNNEVRLDTSESTSESTSELPYALSMFKVNSCFNSALK